MNLPDDELIGVLQEFNPWWTGQSAGDLPDWERTAFSRIWKWVENPTTKRGLVLTGARQVGKTTLYRQVIRRMVAEGFPAERVLYATFDHPILKLAGIERTLHAWNLLFPPPDPDGDTRRVLFLDEVQYAEGWATWLKHRVDFGSKLKIAVTGSATPLERAGAESGVGRWETIPLPTLSFGEFLRLHRVRLPTLDVAAPPPPLHSLFDQTQGQRLHLTQAARDLTPHFYDYLLRSGFPEPSLERDLVRCQRLLREDIIDKVLKRDLTALYGVRKVLEAEKIFLYLCYHDGGILGLTQLTQNLTGISRPTAQSLLNLFEATHLIYRLKPMGYGKQILRGNDKVYLADAALPGAMLLLGRRLLEQPERLGAAVETAFFKHVYTRFYGDSLRFSYWQDRTNRKLEVDLVVEAGDRLIPFEVKHRDATLGPKELKGMRLFLEEFGVDRGYVIGRRWEDLRVIEATSARRGTAGDPLDAKILVVPAALACWCLSG